MIYLIEETGENSQRELARRLLQYGLYQEYGITGALHIERTEFGKPYLPETPEIYFNYSHSKQGILCGIHREEIGVDIEKIIPYKENLAKKICHPNEWKRMQETQEKDRFLTKLWMAKESYLKYKGTGIRSDLREIDLSGCIKDFFRKEDYGIQTVLTDTYGMAVCASQMPLEIKRVGLKEIQENLNHI